MSNFSKALLGGLAGGAKASGEVFDKQIESNEEQRKEKVLAKRQTTLAKLRNDFIVAREETRYDYKDRIRAEENAYTESGEYSGTRIGGIKQSHRDLSQKSDAELKNVMSEQTWQEKERAIKEQREDEEEKQKSDYAKELAEVRNERYKLKSKNKKPSNADKKYAEKQSLATINAGIAEYDSLATLDGEGIELEFEKELKLKFAAMSDAEFEEKSDTEFAAIKSLVKSNGYPNANIFRRDGRVIIRSGGYVYKEGQKGLAAPKVDEEESGAKNTFDELHDALRSNMNSQQPDDGLKSSHDNSIASPKQYKIQR